MSIFRIRRADGVLIVTPEYNFSIPGGLKNVLDWTSRGEDQPWAGKPVALYSASPGPLGGARVQYDLRMVMLFLNASVLVKPEVFIGIGRHQVRCRGALQRRGHAQIRWRPDGGVRALDRRGGQDEGGMSAE